MQPKTLRIDLEVELFRHARASIIVGKTLPDAWARARADWPDLDQSYSYRDEACVVVVDGQCVMLLASTVTISTFAHEAVHVAAWVMDSRGVPVTRENDEVVAYIVEWVVRHGWTQINT